MTLAEIYASKAGHFMTAQEFTDAGITLVDNTPAEITAAALEMAQRTEGPLDSDESQRHFWDAFPRSASAYNDKPLHGEIRMRIGREFLEGYA